ncbi:MAG: serine--tRNA ligase [Chloroflexota bacterium]|nr:serine--tRNA ligase [Chloroflexota bacterium]
MIGLQLIRDDPDRVRRGIARKGEPTDVVDRLLEADGRRRALLAEADALKHERNVGSRRVGDLLRDGRSEDADRLKVQLGRLGARIAALDAEVRETDALVERDLLAVPNLPDDSAPDGRGPDDNPEVRRRGEPLPAGTRPPHWEIAERLGLFDLERGAKISGSGFILYTGAGARLERALVSLMIDLQVARHGYREVWPPVLVNAASARGTGQLPDKEGQMYLVERDELYLAPTAEVPVTNIYRDEILAADALPMRLVAYSPCFRREAGAAGKDTRGLLRVHQFDKVEMVHFVRPEESAGVLEELTSHAEAVLEALELTYRVVERCTADLGFAQARGYDLEAWAPGVGTWLEVSSCSNYTDFQARRINIRFRRDAGAKPELVHTLNGSGLGMSRTVAALLETHLQDDGSVRLPEALRPYFGGLESIG